MRGLAEGPSPPMSEFTLEWLGVCFVDILRPMALMEAEDPVGDFALAAVCKFTNGCTGRSWPGDGPVDRMKSAKSRIDSASIRGSRARGLRVGLLPLGLAWPFVPGTLRGGMGCEPN